LGEHVKVAFALNFCHQLAVTADPELLVEDVLFADVDCVFDGFGRAYHAKQMPSGQKGSFVLA
jgi:hypothetical protein